MRSLTPAERLIVAADFKPTPPQGRDWVKAQVLALADSLQKTGVYLKANSALRACGYDLIDEIHARGLPVFADLKLFDIGETLATDGDLLQEAEPELLTVSCGVAVVGMQALKAKLPYTEVLGVTVLTNLKDEDAKAMYDCSIMAATLRLARLAAKTPLDGLVSSARAVPMLQEKLPEANLTYNVAGIRPAHSIVVGDDQNPDLIVTPTRAFKEFNATRIVVGRPITGAQSPYDATMYSLEEIAAAAA